MRLFWLWTTIGFVWGLSKGPIIPVGSGGLFSGTWPKSRGNKGLKQPSLELDGSKLTPEALASIKNIDASLKSILNSPSRRGEDATEADSALDLDEFAQDLPVFRALSGSQAPAFPVPVPAMKNLAIHYLQTELQLSEATLMNVLMKYSWVMYLKVDTNLKPTVEVLKSFGFKLHHIRSMVSVVPSVLAINHIWTLPEKLLSIQKMFGLSRGQLVKLCVEQPLLLTSSIDRNLAVSEFLRGAIGLSAEQVRNLLQISPRLAMTGLSTLKMCWSVLTSTYGLTPRESRRLIMKCPQLLSQRLLQNGPDKLSFFANELGMPVSEPETRSLLLRYPALLYLDADVFLRPNVALLKKYLEVNEPAELRRLLGVFPQLLGHNPLSLERQCAEALWLLTGDREYEKAAATAAALVADSSAAKMAAGDSEEGDDDQDVVDASQSDTLWDDSAGDNGEGNTNEGEEESSRSGRLNSYYVAADEDFEEKVVPVSLREAVSELAARSEKLDLIGDMLEGTDIILKKRAAKAAAAAAAAGVGTAETVTTSVGERSGPGTSQRRLLRSLGSKKFSSTSSFGGVSTISDSSHAASGVGVPTGAIGMAMEIEATRLLLQACHTLVLPRDRAVQVACAAPWILSYRPERSKRIIGALAVSLGMCREELSHCVALYPRLLCLAVDTKITAVLRSLTGAAAKIYLASLGSDDDDDNNGTTLKNGEIHQIIEGSTSVNRPAVNQDKSYGQSLRQCHDAKSLAAAAEGEASLAADLETAMASERHLNDGVTLYDLSAYESGLELVYSRRRHTIRSMVRAAVLRYPLILGTSMDRIDGRLSEIHSGEAVMPWPLVVNFIRRDESAHERWKSREEKRDEKKSDSANERLKPPRSRGRPRKDTQNL